MRSVRPYGSADPEHLARMSAASEMFLGCPGGCETNAEEFRRGNSRTAPADDEG